MKILFIGTVDFSLNALKKLISIKSNIIGVCTKKQSSFNSDFSDLTPICEQNDIPYKYVDDINSMENILWIKSLNPDIIFCFGWSSLIKKELLELAPMGIIGYHPAALPQNRGRHPLIWALALGLKKSASTFFFMGEGADDGDILSQEYFTIDYYDDAKTLYKKVIDLSLNQIELFVPQLKNGNYKRIKQDHTLSNNWRKRGKIDGIIDFRMCSDAIYNLIRALAKPYVGANVVYKGKNITIWKSEIVKVELPNIESGKILEVTDNYILVKTYDNAIKLLEHEFEELPIVGEYL